MRSKRGIAALALAVTALVAILGSAHAATSTSTYHATADPGQVVAGVPTALTLTLKNNSGSSQSLGAANFSAPTGWAVDIAPPTQSEASLSTAGGNWTVSNVSNVVQFRANSSSDALPAGASVSAPVTVTASCSATGTSWSTSARQSNTYNGAGNGFQLDAAGNPAASTVTGTLDHFDWNPIGTQYVGKQFTVTITAKDASSNTLPCYSGSPTLSGLSGSPTYGSFGSFVGGHASANVTAAVSETAQLTATAGSVHTNLSNVFSILSVNCTSTTPAQDCHAADDTGGTQVSGTPPTGSADFGLGFTPPAGQKQFTCGSASSALTGSSLVAVMPDPSNPNANVTVTLDYDKSIAPGTGVANFNVCVLKVVNSVLTWVGPLSSCSKVVAPCVAGRSRTGVGDLLITLTLPWTDPLVGTG